MPLVEGYGLTEGGVATLNPVDAPRPGSIGKPLPGVRVKISPDGELLIKSPCVFSGYLNDPQATAEILRDGWLHTGDLAYADVDNFLYITGRKKELIVLSSGKKVHPARVESLFKMEPLISHVLLIGDRLPFLTALLTVNPAVAGSASHSGGLSESQAVLDQVRAAVARVNKQLAPFEQIRKYRVLPREFSIEQGELTPTMKLRRSRAISNFQSHIDELYAGRE
jgi:long-chain acyl-CoA synthetase